jgi:hypothetical protein
MAMKPYQDAALLASGYLIVAAEAAASRNH